MVRTDHPIAHRLQQWVDGPTSLLASVMALPLIDGIFPAIVLAGGLATPLDVLQVGLLVFGGSATAAVVLAEFDADRVTGVRQVLTVGIPLTILAGFEAALAPTLNSVLNVVVFERFAALVLLAVAAKTVSADLGELLPRPSAIVALGFVASIDIGGAQVTMAQDPTLVVYAVAAGVVGTTFAVLVVLGQPLLHEMLDVARFRFGSAIALGMLAVSLFHPAYAFAPLAVLGVTVLLALQPRASSPRGEVVSTDGGEEPEDVQRPPHW